MQQLVLTGTMPASDWRPTPVSELPQDWSEIPRVSIDVETKDPDLHDLGCGAYRDGCHVAGFGISFDLGEGKYRSHYLPVRHEGGGNLDLGEVRRYLAGNFRSYRGRVVGADLAYDAAFMRREGITFRDDFRDDFALDDVGGQEALIDEHIRDGYGLDDMLKRRGLPMKDESLLKMAGAYYTRKNIKRVIYQLHAKFVGAYGEWDAESCLHIDDDQQKTVARLGLERACRLEAEVLWTTVLMREAGIRVDVDALERVERWAHDTQSAFLAQFRHATGIEADMGDLRSPGAMEQIVARLGLPPLPTKRKYNKRTKEWEDGQAEIAAETLKAYRDPRMDLLIEAKKVDKIVTTYGPSIRRYMVRRADGRYYIHGTLKNIRGPRSGDDEGDEGKESGTVSRRFAHVHPNLGNQPNPTKDEDDALRVMMGTLWRGIFIPDDPAEEDWGLADVSQQEPRFIVHFAEGVKDKYGNRLKGAREMGDAFRRDKRTDNHKMISQFTRLPRGPAKICFLARCYGAGMRKIALQLEDKIREINKIFLADPTSDKVPNGWTALPDGWSPIITATYGERDWKPPGKCAGDRYETADPVTARIIKQFDDYVPYVKQLARIAQDQALKNGGIRLIDGSMAHLERNQFTGEYEEAHKALNKLAQCNGALQLKLFLIASRKAGYLMRMTVHDDASRPVPKGAEGTRQLLEIRDIFENVIPYVSPDRYADHPGPYKSRIPFLVKVKRGSSYGTADGAQEVNG